MNYNQFNSTKIAKWTKQNKWLTANSLALMNVSHTGVVLWINEGQHIISIHRHSSDVGVDGCNTVSDYAAAVRHVSCIYCGECGRVSLCASTLCVCVLLSLSVSACGWVCAGVWLSILDVYYRRCCLMYFVLDFKKLFIDFSLLSLCSSPRVVKTGENKNRYICKRSYISPRFYCICQYANNITG